MDTQWNGLNGRAHKRKPRSWLSKLGTVVKINLIWLWQTEPPVKLAYVLMLLVLLALLAGCATPSIQSSEPQRLPTMPSSTLSVRSESYSASASMNIERWQKTLTEAVATQKP